MPIKNKIKDIYTKHTNYNEPEQAINQAESLKSLSIDLYTDSKRFIYELLQNADDSAIDGQSVDIVIKLFNDTLVIAHSGKIFTDRDIQGLCSINNGTKKSYTTKTGYKGIGFKSVFGQSNQVAIFTDNEYFKFDANNDFDWKEEWGADQETWENDNDRDFLYPWQIIPIYLDDSNNDVSSEIQEYLTNGNFNVATIIKVLKLGEIKKAIKELSSNVNMFLFLKNINSLQFVTEETTLIEIERSEDELVLKKDTEVQVSWLVKTIELTVEDELKQILQDDANIPKKLKETDNIELTLAIKKTENGLEKLSDNETLLYAYLPTDEKRYKLPILVNTTFLTSANRESLHENSKWNQWLFKSISLELFKWIAELIQGKYLYQAYNLIPNKLNVYDDLANAYNEGIDEAIDSIPFILSKDKNILKVDEAIIDETNLSEKTFIGKKIIKKFMKYKIGEDNKIVKAPFVFSNKKLKKIGVKYFSWDEISAFLAFEDFKSEHTVKKNMQLIEYFKNESTSPSHSFPTEKLKDWNFIYDHKGKLNYLNKICFPKIDDENWNNEESELDYVNELLYKLVMSNSNIKSWLQKLGVQEKTDITYLTTVIIPNAESYITFDNSSKTIKYIYELYSNQDIKDEILKQLNKLKLLTTKGSLIPASKCYFSDKYNSKFKIENLLDDDIFINKNYLDLSSDIDEVRRFFKILGVQDDIEIIKINEKISKHKLLQKFKTAYFSHYLNTYGMSTDSYKNIISLELLNKTNNFEFSKIFWDTVIGTLNVEILKENARGYWGHADMSGQSSGSVVENYLIWYIKNNKCLPTTKGICKKSTKIFLNTDEIKKIVGKYLPVFDGVELNQDWKSFFNFKTEITLKDYLKLLVNIMNDKDDENKIKKDNKKRVQLVYKVLLEQSINWGTEDIEKVESWALTAQLTDENDNIVLCNELKYYADGDNSIFQNIHKFIALDEENKAHQNIETFLGYLDIEIFRQDNFNINFEGEETESDLKYELESIFPYLEQWIQKFDSEFDLIGLNNKLNTIQITEVSKLSLVYDGTPLKTVQIHLKEDELLITTPWSSNTSMLELPKALCRYLDIKGYEDKLAFLLKVDDEYEIREYFESENIELPTIQADEISKEEAIATLGTTEKEFNELKQISANFQHASQPDIEKLKYVQRLLNRSKERVLEHLQSLYEYNCENVDSSALTILSGIKKNGNDIFIIPRPSDNGKVILHYESEFDTLEYADSELWYENGISTPKKLTFGKVLREAKINKIPINKTKKNIIDVIYNPTNEDITYEPILPSSFDIAKTMASLANTNGGYLLIGCSKEDGIIGLNSEFNIGELTSKSIEYSSYFKEFEFEEKKIDGKTFIVVKIDKSDETILIEGKKYIRYGSIIIEELKDNNKPLIITEGKTDWKHLKKALERFQKDGLYKDLYVQFLEYEDMNMGDGELDRMVQTYSKIKQIKKHIFMFDRDNNTYVKKYAKEEFNNHGNNVFSFCIPKISEELDGICIEFYYKKDELKTKDNDGKRIFLGEEFLDNGNSICGQYVTEKRKAKALDILDRDKKVYLRSDIKWENNIALSKNDFTNNVINDVERFDGFDIEYFKLIFDVIEQITNDK